MKDSEQHGALPPEDIESETFDAALPPRARRDAQRRENLQPIFGARSNCSEEFLTDMAYQCVSHALCYEQY
jgi:hypothetical protein